MGIGVGFAPLENKRVVVGVVGGAAVVVVVFKQHSDVYDKWGTTL